MKFHLWLSVRQFGNYKFVQTLSNLQFQNWLITSRDKASFHFQMTVKYFYIQVLKQISKCHDDLSRSSWKFIVLTNCNFWSLSGFRPRFYSRKRVLLRQRLSRCKWTLYQEMCFRTWMWKCFTAIQMWYEVPSLFVSEAIPKLQIWQCLYKFRAFVFMWKRPVPKHHICLWLPLYHQPRAKLKSGLQG